MKIFMIIYSIISLAFYFINCKICINEVKRRNEEVGYKLYEVNYFGLMINSLFFPISLIKFLINNLHKGQ